MSRAILVAAVAVFLGGCALPSWVPFIGGRDAPAERTRAPRMARPQPPSEPAVEPAPARPAAAIDPETVVDRVIAVVNNDAITLGELQESIAAYRQENPQRSAASDEELGRQFLGRLIETRLQLQEADREKIGVDDAELADELQQRMNKLGLKTHEELEAMARAQGMTVDTIKKRVREALRVAKVIRRKVALRISVTDQEIDEYLAANRAKLETGLPYHARHILVAPDMDTDAAWEQARIRAEMIRTQLAEGADFADMARKHSRDASSKDGGDLGVLTRGELAQEIESRILALDPGQTSAPFRSALGYHLFRLESKETLEGPGLERARQQIREILFRQKYDARFQAWIDELRKRAVIEVRM